jgi:transcription antitermination factor NusG
VRSTHSVETPLTQAIFAVPADDSQWFVLHTRSRQEKSLAADLAALSILHFLPLASHIRFYGRRKTTVAEPLFPGYLFLRGSVDDSYQADRTNRVASIIRVADQPSLNDELRNIHLALENRAPLEPYSQFKTGHRVIVRAGPFKGLQGLVEVGAHNGRLVLQISSLGQAVSLEIDASLLDPL